MLLTSVIIDGLSSTVIRALPITSPVTNGDEPDILSPPFLFISKVTVVGPAVPSVATHHDT